MMFEEVTLDRRTIMARLALLVGAAALPAEALAVARKGPLKRFLAPAQFATLTALADTVIPATDTPGAAAVGVPRLIDAMLANWASAATRTRIADVIAQVDKIAAEAGAKSFAALPAARRKTLLAGFDRDALKPDPHPAERPDSLLAMMHGPAVMNPGWLVLKDLVITLYYTSETAMTQEVVYEHVPGKWEPSLPITPGMRPFAGNGGPF